MAGILNPSCTVYIAMSLDGFIAKKNGSIDWLYEASAGFDGDYGYAQFMSTVDTLVLGRNTYKQVLGFEQWPYSGKRVLVMTNNPGVSHYGEAFVQGDVKTLFMRLASQGVRHVYVDGGQVIQQCLAADVVNTLVISIMPITLGEGVPLFSKCVPERKLQLLNSESWTETGVVQLTYRVVGPPPQAEWHVEGKAT